jgi:hypothetical protein
MVLNWEQGKLYLLTSVTWNNSAKLLQFHHTTFLYFLNLKICVWILWHIKYVKITYQSIIHMLEWGWENYWEWVYSKTSLIQTNLERTLVQIGKSLNHGSPTESVFREVIRWNVICLSRQYNIILKLRLFIIKYIYLSWNVKKKKK